MNNIEHIATQGTPGVTLDAARFMRREIFRAVDLDDTRNDKLVADVQRLYTAATFANTVDGDYFTEATRSAVEMAVGDLYGMSLTHVFDLAKSKRLRAARDFISQMLLEPAWNQPEPPVYRN